MEEFPISLPGHDLVLGRDTLVALGVTSPFNQEGARLRPTNAAFLSFEVGSVVRERRRLAALPPVVLPAVHVRAIKARITPTGHP